VNIKRRTGPVKWPTAFGSAKRPTEAAKRPTEAVEEDTDNDENTSVGLSSGVIRPMRSVLLGEASSSTPVRHVDSMGRRVDSMSLRSLSSIWRVPDPDDSDIGRSPASPRFSWLLQKPVLAAAAAAVVVVAVVVSLTMSPLNRVGGGTAAPRNRTGSLPTSAAATAPPGDFNAVVPGPSDSAQPEPPPPSEPAPAKSSPHTAALQPTLRRAALYSLQADVAADGPSGQRVSSVLGSATFPDSTSMFVGCSDQPATLTYRLDGAGVRLTATAGLTSDATPGNLVTRVTVRGDGRTLAQVTVSLDRQASIAADLTGVRSLVVSAQRVSGSCAPTGQPYGVLGNAQLLRKQ
jgi:hypothetical protein